MSAGTSTDNTIPPGTGVMDDDSIKRLVDLIRETVETTVAKTIAQVQFQTASTSVAPDSASPTSPSKAGIELRHGDRLKAEDLRIALLMGKIPDTSGLLIDTKTFARLLSISKAHFYRLQAEEAVPLPIHVGHVKRWRLAEILEWIEADCPTQANWSARRQANSKRKGR